MKLINQKVNVIQPGAPRTEEEICLFFERIGRKCWKSEARIKEGSWKDFYEMLTDKKHLSVVEHYPLTVEIVTNRAIANELVRHRIAAYTQESTRYVNYAKCGMQFIIPSFFKNKEEVEIKEFKDLEALRNGKRYNEIELSWMLTFHTSERIYNIDISSGLKPQEARDLLPLALKTEIVATYDIRMWYHVFAMRRHPAAHPMIRELMELAYAEFSSRYPTLFNERTVK